MDADMLILVSKVFKKWQSSCNCFLKYNFISTFSILSFVMYRVGTELRTESVITCWLVGPIAGEFGDKLFAALVE
jgi:hypothetical protein